MIPTSSLSFTARGPLLAGLCLFVSSLLGETQAQTPVARPKAEVAAQAAAQARDAQRDEAVAAALVAALEQELGGRRIRLRLDPAQVGVASVRDRVVAGRGALQIGDSEEWLGFRYRVLYDAVMATTGYPELQIGGSGEGGRVLPNDAALVGELDERVLALVGEEFGHQQARMQLDRIVTVETGTRYLRIDAEGLVDFGRDGAAQARVEGLYDRISGDWLRVVYALDGAGATGAPDEPATPQRPIAAGVDTSGTIVSGPPGG